MTIRSTLAVLVVLTVLAAGCGTANNTAVPEPSTPSTTPPGDSVASPTLDIDALLAQWAAHTDVVGALAIVSTPNQPDRLALTGSADRETLTPTDADIRPRPADGVAGSGHAPRR